MIPWTARIFLLRTRTLAPRNSLGWVQKTSWVLIRFSSGGIQRWFPRRALAKIPLISCALGGFPARAKCDESPVLGGPQIKTGFCLDNGGFSSARFIWRLRLIFSLLIRACILWLKFGPLLCLYPFTFLSNGFKSLWLCLLLRVTESSGPTCIKLGQWASTRRDLFSEEFCVRFSKLHIKVSPHPWSYTQYSLGKAFGEDWEKIFTFGSQEPVGSGCVAQVYKAYVNISTLGESVQRKISRNTGLDSALEAWQVSGLKGLFSWFWRRKPEGVSDDYEGHWLHHNYDPCTGAGRNSSPGEDSRTLVLSSKKDHLIPVAIKVLHPGLVQQVQMDLFLMKTGSRFAELFPGVSWLSLTEIVEEFEKLMIQQIDLRYEARNLERFRINFQGVDYVKFPIPLCPFVTKNILVETFEESRPIAQYLQNEVKVELRQKIAKMGIDMLLKMVFVDNFVHADLHPGNILVQGVENFSDCQDEKITVVDLLDTLVLELRPSCPSLQLVLLDAGITAELQISDLQNLRAVFTAVILGQGEKVAELILHHSRANKCKDVEQFKRDMAELVSDARNNTIALGKVQVGGLLSSVFKLLMTHQVKLESNFASVIFAIMVLEGLGRTLDPELDILKAAKPFLIKPTSSLL